MVPLGRNRCCDQMNKWRFFEQLGWWRGDVSMFVFVFFQAFPYYKTQLSEFSENVCMENIKKYKMYIQYKEIVGQQLQYKVEL